MRAIQAISTILFLIALGFFLFDLFCHLYEFTCQLFGMTCPSVVQGVLEKISIENIWSDISKENYVLSKSLAETIIPSGIWTTIMHMPAPTVLFILSMIFYIPFKILKLLGVAAKEKDWRE